MLLLLTKREIVLIFSFSCFLALRGVLDLHQKLAHHDQICDDEYSGRSDASLINRKKGELSARIRDDDSSAPVAPVVYRKEHPKKSAMCMIVVNEEAYLDEFVDYHFALGFDKFFIYDNSEGFEMKQWGKLKGDHVEVIHFPGEAPQMPAYVECTKLVQSAGPGVFEWVAYFDPDEFLVLKKHDHLADMLEEYCRRGGLVINWFVFSHNNWNVQSPQPVTRRFQYRQIENTYFVKIIARVDDILEVNGDQPHRIMKFKDNLGYKDTNGKKYTHSHFNTNGPVDVAVLHHYKLKSLKEFVQKRQRGSSVNEPPLTTEKFRETANADLIKALASERLPSDFLNYSAHMFDDSAWQFLKSRVPGYALYDTIAVSPFIKKK